MTFEVGQTVYYKVGGVEHKAQVIGLERQGQVCIAYAPRGRHPPQIVRVYVPLRNVTAEPSKA
jgi:hypothetical protein